MMRAPATWLLLAMACFSGGAAKAPDSAVLNLQVRVDAGVLHVSDIWRNAGPKSDAVIGSAPPPGRSFSIEAPQLAYIARLYDVDWRPSSGAERTSVERGGRPLDRDEVLDQIRRALVATGVPDTVTLDLVNFSPIMVPPMSFPTVQVDGLSYEQTTDRFTANISVSSEGMDRQTMQITGHAIQMTDAVVTVRRLQPDDVIADSDVKLVRMPQRRLSGDPASTITQVVGQAARRTIAAGQPVMISDIGQPMMVAKGAPVVLVMESPGLSIAAQGLALSSGGRDDVIEVMNPLSRAVVSARVIGPGRTSVSPNSTPLTRPARHGAPPNPQVSQ
jgi:flagella basal body P-ring formation protein FlgA